MLLTVNTRIHNRYRIVRHLAGGGMGHIYEAIDERFDSTVALKQMTLSGVSAERAFQREAQMLNHLRHPALPRVTDYFSEDEGQFLVMDYIPGKDLSDMLAEHGQPFLVNDVLAWLDELLDVLTYLHSQDVIHRDIKPQNLKLNPDNHLILLDFGIAKNQTGSRSIQAFTPQFAPLEQIQGEGTDPRSDLYSAAATAYALLTNQHPPSSMTRFVEVSRQQPDPVAPLHQVNPLVPPAISAVLMQALSLYVSDRPANATAMQNLLRQARQYPDVDPTIVAAAPAALPPIQGAAMARTQGQQTMKARPASTPSPISVPAESSAAQGTGTSEPRRSSWLLPAIGGGGLVLLLVLVGAAAGFITGFAPSDAPPEQQFGISFGGNDNNDEDNDEERDTSDTGRSAAQSSNGGNAGPSGNTDAEEAEPAVEQTVRALDTTATALASLEQTAQADASAGTATALRQTEQALHATTEALAAAETAEAAQPTMRPAPTAPPRAAQSNVCDRATVIGSIAELAIQESPLIDNTVLPGTAPRGATVDVLCVEPETNDERVWVWVEYAGVEGWMSARYLRFEQGIPVGQCNVGTVVNTSALSIREETNRGSRYLGEVPAGDQVAVMCVPHIFSDGRAWAFVAYAGVEGWMSTNYLNIE
jgi:serine/threonine protein kinase